MRKKIAHVTLRKTFVFLHILKLNWLFFVLSNELERLFCLRCSKLVDSILKVKRTRCFTDLTGKDSCGYKRF